MITTLNETQLIALMAATLRANPNGKHCGGQAPINACIAEAQEILRRCGLSEKALEEEGEIDELDEEDGDEH